ncbi:MAG: glycosyltransferase family 4 protein [Candidatus Zhuqueibacterota bacterium]
MKVLYYCSKFPPIAGGAGTNAHYLGTYLSEHGHQVYVVCEFFPGLKKYEKINDNYTVYRASVPFIENRGSGLYFLLLCVMIAWRGLRLLIKEKIDVIHILDTATGIAGLITRFFVKKPSVYLFGGSMTYEYMCNAYQENEWDPAKGENYVWENARGFLKFVLFVEKQFFLRNDRIYTNAQYLSDMLEQHLGMVAPKVRLIYNGINTDYLSRANIPDIKTELGYHRMAYVGVRFVKYKALEILIRACAPILEKFDAHLVIAGDGPEKERLLAEASNHPRIDFVGNLSWERNIQYVRSADVFALPTLVDKTPNCVMEALSLETPVITTNIDGVKELVPDGCGILIEPNQVDELQKSIVRVFQHPDAARGMGQKARKFMVQEFDWKTTCDRVLEIYNELVAE